MYERMGVRCSSPYSIYQQTRASTAGRCWVAIMRVLLSQLDDSRAVLEVCRNRAIAVDAVEVCSRGLSKSTSSRPHLIHVPQCYYHSELRYSTTSSIMHAYHLGMAWRRHL